jgi:hypothetical protein
MVSNPPAPDQPKVVETEATGEIHDCECLVDGCPQQYSPSYGYFTLIRNDDH